MILPFNMEIKNPNDLEYRNILLSATEEGLKNVKNIKRLSRDPIQYSVEEKVVGSRLEITDDEALDMADLRNADTVILGEFIQTQTEGYIRGRVLDKKQGTEINSIPLEIASLKDYNLVRLSREWSAKVEKAFLGNHDKFSESFEFNTKNEKALIEVNKGILELSKYEEENILNAIRHFENAISFDSKFSLAHALLSESLCKLLLVKYYYTQDLSSQEMSNKRKIELMAQRHAQIAFELNSDSLESNRALAMFYYTISVSDNFYDKDKAREISFNYINQALKINPIDKNLEWLVFLLNSEKSPSIEIKDRNIEQDSFENQIQLARVYERRSMNDDAIFIYQKIIQKSPNHIHLLNELARVYRKKGQTQKSRELLDNITKKKSKDYRAWTNLAEHYQQTKESSKAESIYTKIAKEFPDKFSFIASKVRKNYIKDKNKINTGINLFKEMLIKDKPNEDMYNAEIGILSEYKGDINQAIEFYNIALNQKMKKYSQENPEVGILHNRLANVYELKKDYNRSLTSYKQAFEILSKLYPKDSPEIQRIQKNISKLSAYKEIKAIVPE